MLIIFCNLNTNSLYFQFKDTDNKKQTLSFRDFYSSMYVLHKSYKAQIIKFNFHRFYIAE